MITKTPDVSLNMHLMWAEIDSISAGSCGPLGFWFEGGFETVSLDFEPVSLEPPLLLDVPFLDLAGTSLMHGPCLKKSI